MIVLSTCKHSSSSPEERPRSNIPSCHLLDGCPILRKLYQLTSTHHYHKDLIIQADETSLQNRSFRPGKVIGQTTRQRCYTVRTKPMTKMTSLFVVGASEFLQPLDQLPNKKWKEGLCGVTFPSRRKDERGRDHFLDRVFAAIDSAMNSECIRNGFKMAGLILASPSKMLAKLMHEHSNPTSIAQELDNMENPDSEWETGRWRHKILEDGTMEELLAGPIESTETIGDVSATGLFPISGHVITDPEFRNRWRHHQQGKILKTIDANMRKQERRMKLELKRLDQLLAER
ncbi:hypothetical protein BLNAU_13620 [Blattamonas nauphoetae]|uniref:Uncharacterized protein n=1 Tax=Blattamonas nauphoetae TaxID=2049346 RepID=A0ABQ9XG73_9EUKA|nr:hypothetical protein BLNAU_13620 [Blattamonas nauphoetae]